jgi:peptidoglycan-associated lipoprotein
MLFAGLRVTLLVTIGCIAIGCATKPETTATDVPQSTAPGAAAQFGAVPPAAAVGITPGSARDFSENVGDRVLFAYDRADLDQTARGTLDRQAAWLQRYATVSLLIEGHADERGTREYNLALGARRAAAIREYLSARGVGQARIDVASYGKERPMCEESSESCWQQNRRGISTIRAGAAS